MRKSDCSRSLDGNLCQSPERRNCSSWLSSSFNNVAKTCYSIESSEDSEDYYRPARSSSQTLPCSSETIDAELGLTEDHFSCPEGYFGLSTMEELEMAIENCEEIIMKTPEKSEKRKMLVKKLVQLRYMYQEIKDCPPDVVPKDNIVLGHLFELNSSDKLRKLYCEKCCGHIWGVLQNWWQCKNCGIRCHSKCVNFITRICALTKVNEKQPYILDICPEKGLSEQKYRCAECKRKFLFKDAECLPRLCEYNGLSYCSDCHWNNSIVIPARVIHNWDFTPRRVCRASLQFLKLMVKKPGLSIESLNPLLFGIVAELKSVKKLREDILLMKKYFLTCHTASEERLLLHLRDRQHFVENADIYSLQDLMDVLSGKMVQYLEGIRSTFMKHITESCQGCRGKGFICEFCKSAEVLFPFNPQTCSCPQCNSLFHIECYQRYEGNCPKCQRQAKLKEGTTVA